MELIIKKLEEENKQLRMALDSSKSANKRIKKEARHNDYNKLQRRFYSKCQENKHLRDVLEFYADVRTYMKQPSQHSFMHMNPSPISKDEGVMARVVLNNM